MRRSLPGNHLNNSRRAGQVSLQFDPRFLGAVIESNSGFVRMIAYPRAAFFIVASPMPVEPNRLPT